MLCIDFGRAAANFFGHSFEPSGSVVVDINQAGNGNDTERDPLFHRLQLYRQKGNPSPRSQGWPLRSRCPAGRYWPILKGSSSRISFPYLKGRRRPHFLLRLYKCGANVATRYLFPSSALRSSRARSSSRRPRDGGKIRRREVQGIDVTFTDTRHDADDAFLHIGPADSAIAGHPTNRIIESTAWTLPPTAKIGLRCG